LRFPLWQTQDQFDQQVHKKTPECIQHPGISPADGFPKNFSKIDGDAGDGKGYETKNSDQDEYESRRIELPPESGICEPDVREGKKEVPKEKDESEKGRKDVLVNVMTVKDIVDII
jgi:hypothetical protein